MQHINEEMQSLLSDMNEHSRLKREVTALEAQKSKVEEKLRDLKSILRYEQRDVDELSRITLQSVWLRICGTHEEVLRREQADVDAAMLKCAAAKKELAEIKQEIASRRAKLSDLSSSERRYNELLSQKHALLVASPEGETLRRLEEKAAKLQSRQKEITEALDAGGAALHIASEIVDCLKTAGGFATWDVLGGGLLADMAKHSELNNAQSLIEQLQRQLRRFRTELKDVQLDADIPVDSFLSVADFLFDGLIADWMMKSRISRALTSAKNTQTQIEQALFHLREEMKAAKREEENVRRMIDNAVKDA